MFEGAELGSERDEQILFSGKSALAIWC